MAEARIISNRFLGEKIGIYDKHGKDICCGDEVFGERKVLNEGIFKPIKFRGFVYWDEKGEGFCIYRDGGLPLLNFSDSGIILSSLMIMPKGT